MNTQSLANAAVRSVLWGGVVSVVSLSSAWAQQTEQRPAPIGSESAPPSELEEVTVTGSRIRRDELSLTQPTQIIDAGFIADRGITNAQTALATLPGVFAGASPVIASNTGAANQGVGQRTLSLFNLGSQRTLTLVDGVRFVSSNSPVGGSSAPGSQVDVNNIPVALIDRIEVVKVGGAAVYGADAVAGVVNYILKRDYQGAEFSVDYRSFGNSQIHDEISVRGLLGGNFSDPNGRNLNLVANLEYNRTETVNSNEVPSLFDSWTLQQPTAAQRVTRQDGSVVIGQLRLFPQPRAGILSFSGLITPAGSAITNLGVGRWGDGNFYQFDPSGNGGIVTYNPGIPTGNAVWASGGDGLNLIRTNTALEGAERYNFSTMLNYELADNITLTGSIYANKMLAANPGFQAERYSSGVFGSTSTSLRFPTSHPFLPAASRSRLEGLLGGPGNFFMHKGWLEFGAREIVNDSSVELYRLGIEGSNELLGQSWRWGVSGQKGWSGITSESIEVNDNRWFAAMDVGINPTTKQIDCRYNYDPTVGANYVVTGFGITSAENVLGGRGGCKPFNPFGTPSADALKYVTYNTVGSTRLEQDVATAYASGGLINLPGGALEVAVGFEHRREFAAFANDGTAKISGFSDNSLSGGYKTNDFFGELLIPVISAEMGVPALHQLGLEASYRSMDNSRSGTDEAFAVGLNFRPFEDLFGDFRIRANLSETVRAPAVTELFLPVVESSQFATDPCQGTNLPRGPAPAVRQANCAKEGIPTNFVSIAGNASRRGFTGGNPNLLNEQGDSLNIGIVYSPSFVPGRLTVAADYTEIDIEDAIVSFTLTNIMEACYDATNYPNEFCNKFTRGPDKQLPAIGAFTSGYVNAALRKFATYEYSVRYGFDTESLGAFDVLSRVYRLKRDLVSNTGFDRSDTTGQYNNAKIRGNIVVTHNYKKLSSFLDVFFSGRGKRDVTSSEPLQYIDDQGSPYTELPSVITANLGATYIFNEKIKVRGQVQNLTDWEPSGREKQAGRWTWGRVYSIGVDVSF